jgi:mRNA interferase MazF
MAARRVVSYPRRGEVYLVSFDPTVGAEITKTRPALILQNDIGNRYSPLTIVAAITSRYEERLYPHQALIVAPEGGMKVNSVVLLNQIRSVDKKRLVKRLGMLKPDTMRRVDRALQISVGLVPL